MVMIIFCCWCYRILAMRLGFAMLCAVGSIPQGLWVRQWRISFRWPYAWIGSVS